jgi:hypothetical protein
VSAFSCQKHTLRTTKRHNGQLVRQVLVRLPVASFHLSEALRSLTPESWHLKAGN